MTNEIIKCLTERRSIRDFKDTPIEKEKLDAILHAGTYAPTGMNRQSPVIVAVTDPSVREKIRKMNASILGNPDSDPFYGAPVIIIVLADKNVRTYIEDGSLVLGNIMNAAHSVDVDSCWIHRAKEEFETDEGKALLASWGLDTDLVGIGHCALGYRNCAYPEVRARKENYIIEV